MKAGGPNAFKKMCLRGLSLAGLLASAYLIFIAVVSIWVGLDSKDQAGFWAPLLAGALLFSLVSWILYRVARRALFSKKRDGFIA